MKHTNNTNKQNNNNTYMFITFGIIAFIFILVGVRYYIINRK